MRWSRDRHGRLLAFIGMPGIGDYGLTMIKRSRATEDTYDTAYRKQGLYQAAKGNAEAADRHM